MSWTRVEWVACAICGILSLALPVTAAPNLSIPLTGFSGDSNQPATVAAVDAAGLNFFSAVGPIMVNNDNGTPDDPLDDFLEQQGDDTVVFDSSGAHFGTVWDGDGGRNYMRTNDTDYATTSFVAEVTFENDDDEAVFIGLGAGDRALFGTPDWSTLFSSASFWPEPANDKFTRFRTQNDVNNFGDTTVAGFAAGTHRFRMTFNANNGQLLGEIDLNYAGGVFVADAVSSNFPIVTTSLYAADGWPTEPSRIFFGGDDGAVFRDLVIRVVPEPASVMILLGGAAIAAACGRRRV